MSSEIQTQIDENHDAESKASAPEPKAGKGRFIMLLIPVLGVILGWELQDWIALYWTSGISLLIFGLLSFPYRGKRFRAYTFGKWSLLTLLYSALATFLLFLLVKGLKPG